jgi:hypothetical protein
LEEKEYVDEDKVTINKKKQKKEKEIKIIKLFIDN